MTMGIGTFHSAGSAAHERDADRVVVTDLQARRGGELYGLARRLGLDADEANDAVQETLMRAWVALDARDPIHNLDAWAFKTLYRICMDRHRWRRRVRLLGDRLRPSSEFSPASPVAERLSLWATVDRLPERQRAVVYLRYRADLSFEEIGAALGIQPVSARSHVSRALDRLAVLIREEEETR
jgi:RNA polymerase sigma-70 factor, ECF subfamily